MTNTAAPDTGAASIDDADLSLIDDTLEDEGRSEEDLWDEMEEAETGAGNLDPDDDGLSDDDADKDGDDNVGTDPGDAEATGDKPAADAAPNNPDGAGTEQGDAPLWSTASPEHREAYRSEIDQWKTKDRRYRGQISALQQQLNDANARLKTSARSGDRPDATTASAGAASDYLKSEDWTKFKEDYPELSAPMEAIIGQQSSVISDLRNQAETMQRELQAIGTDRRTAALSEQEALLNEEHKDWQNVAAEVGFADWVQSQPRHMREAAIRNAENIVDAAEAADLISRYKQHRSAQTPPADTARAETPDKTPLSDKRKRQLEAANSAKTRGPGSSAGIPENGDPAALWDAFEEMDRRKSGG